FPDPPSLVLETPLAPCDGELALGPSRGEILRRIKHREVLADDLVRRIALQALGARVPRQYITVWIEGEDRAVVYAVDEQAVQRRRFGRLDALSVGRLRRAAGVSSSMHHAILSESAPHRLCGNEKTKMVLPGGNSAHAR